MKDVRCTGLAQDLGFRDTSDGEVVLTEGQGLGKGSGAGVPAHCGWQGRVHVGLGLL